MPASSAGKAMLATILFLSTMLFVDSSREILREETDPLQLVLSKYLNNDELEDHLHDFVERCSSISQLVSIGKSVNGRELYVLEISDKPGVREAEPHLKYVGNLHGNEPTGRVFTLGLAEWLCKNYNKDATATKVVKDLHLWLMPSANPDGFDDKSRSNANNRDLNRDFPDRFENRSMAPTGHEQPETAALMAWSLANHFIASLAFHEGALVANYPYDGSPDHTTRYMRCPDDATFIMLAKAYADNHRLMALSSNNEFPNGGITNGAAWYPIYGSMQDWMYLKAGSFEITLEVSERKWPPESTLATLFEDNRKALLDFALTAAFSGLRGTVNGQEKSLRAGKGIELSPLVANITVEGIPLATFSSSKHGDFYRPLAPGEYTIIVKSDGYKTETVDVVIPADGTGLKHNFILTRKKQPKGKIAQPLDSGSFLRDSFILVSIGLFIFYGLWAVHMKITKRALFLARHRSI